MIRVSILLLFILMAHLSFSQEPRLVDYSSFCERLTDGPGKHPRERIQSVENVSGFWVIKATIFKTCGLKLYPTLKKTVDTLYVVIHSIQYQMNVLDNQDTIITMSNPEECGCAYLLNLKVNTDTLKNVKIDGRTLPISNEIYETHQVTYFVYRGDTTGYRDKYGLRQGVYIYERANGRIMKVHFIDNEPSDYRLYDSSGKLLLETKDIEDIDNFK